MSSRKFRSFYQFETIFWCNFVTAVEESQNSELLFKENTTFCELPPSFSRNFKYLK